MKRRLQSTLSACFVMCGVIAFPYPAAADSHDVALLVEGRAAANQLVAETVARQTEFTRVSVPFSVPQTLRDAVKVTEVRGYPVESYRFENREIVGEFCPSTGLSVDEYLSTFQSTYGTKPEVVSAIITAPVTIAEEWTKQHASAAPAAGPTFQAPPASVDSINTALRSFRERNTSLQGKTPAEARSHRR